MCERMVGVYACCGMSVFLATSCLSLHVIPTAVGLLSLYISERLTNSRQSLS
jgi:hypothetical protein